MVNLKILGYFSSGFTPKNSEISLYKGKFPYYKVSDMNSLQNKKYMTHTNLYYNGCKKPYLKNSIIFPKNGGAVFTNKKRILMSDSIVDLNTGVYTPFMCLDFEFIFIIFSSIDFKKCYKGTALPTINMDEVKKIKFGLPPVAEQSRIVTKFNFILDYITTSNCR